MGLTNSSFGAGAVRVCGRGKDVERLQVTLVVCCYVGF